ncbi:MAG: HAD family hydrolase [Ruminococcaceae bacterium]|nr:HAD family hydrolase [Oscillospiraceae bacterium]
MIKLVIFDLDGTLLYTLDSIAKSANHILADYGYEAIETDVYRHYVGDGIYELLDRAFSHAGETVKVTDEMVLRFRSYFKEDRNFHLRIYEGIEELLAFLKQKHIKIACNTNKPDPNAKLLLHEQFGDAFDVILGQRDGVPKKPDPAGAREIIDAIGASPVQALYVGDSDVDIFTAKNCGCFAVGAAWGYRGREELQQNGADFIAEHPSDIIEFVKCKLD